MRKNPLVSIVVPIYKVERYLPRCIESILQQTYTNFELILVDDGTPDRSGIICDRYAEKDSRIKVIHKENGGVSSARNTGIDTAQGEWITFVDSDDWISEDYLSVLVTPLLYDKYELIVGTLDCRSFLITSRKGENKIIQKQENGNDEILPVINMVEFFGPAFKLYDKNIIHRHQIRFDSGIAMGEDSIFVARYLKYCNRILLTGRLIYHYNCLNQLSVTNRFPYFEDRKLWDLHYLKECSEILAAFDIRMDARKTVMLKKAVSGFKTVATAIAHNFAADESSKRIAELFDYYSDWINDKNVSLGVIESEEIKILLRHIIDKNSEAVYELLKPQRQSYVCLKAKNVLKTLLRPFIEKYRDGLIKFKF
jgi:glycosyltransferase involved in cell wall biosynthesis